VCPNEERSWGVENVLPAGFIKRIGIGRGDGKHGL